MTQLSSEKRRNSSLAKKISLIGLYFISYLTLKLTTADKTISLSAIEGISFIHDFSFGVFWEVPFPWIEVLVM